MGVLLLKSVVGLTRVLLRLADSEDPVPEVTDVPPMETGSEDPVPEVTDDPPMPTGSAAED